ncbi:MAG: hypothetical protein POELPBGB_01307 [Bacteroidia bacterium]|nr:hypothetical protein [Bacteroidia bacterium]
MSISMSTKKTNRVLALYPNHRGFGYASFENNDLPRDCGIITIRPLENGKSLLRMKELIDRLKPSRLVLPNAKVKSLTKSPRVINLLKSIEKYSNATDLKVHSYSREEVRKVFEKVNSKTKFEIAKTITKWMPQFSYKLPRERKPWTSEDYYMGMFDAISLSLAYYYFEK